MPLNIPGVLAVFKVLWNPKLIIPQLTILGKFSFQKKKEKKRVLMRQIEQTSDI